MRRPKFGVVEGEAAAIRSAGASPGTRMRDMALIQKRYGCYEVVVPFGRGLGTPMLVGSGADLEGAMATLLASYPGASFLLASDDGRLHFAI